MNSHKVVVENLCKVFGTSPKQAIDMLAGGATKEEVFSRTGQIVGVHNVSFEVKEGEASIFRPENGSYTLMARVQMADWPRIAAAAK